MNAIKRHPYFSVWIAFCVVLFVVGMVWLLRLRHGSRDELAGVAKKRQQREQLWNEAQSSVPMNAESFTEQHPDTVIPAVNDSVPRKPLDAFIALVAAREKMRRLAANQEVGLQSDESFGFAAYAHEGPRENELSVVHEQLGLVQLLVEMLFAAHPGKLLAIRRELPSHGGADEGRDAPEDFFALDTRLEPRLIGQIEGRAIELEFTGQTPVLRTFLNSLATAPELLLVRSVKVEPVPENTKLPGRDSKFSVVVQHVKPTFPVGNADAVPDLPPPLAVWIAPPSGGDQAGDLFNPPTVGFGKREVRSREAAAQLSAGAGFELLAVKRELYRLQLVGYFGELGNYTATFVSPGSPETLRAREGHHFESLGLTLKHFAIKHVGPARENDQSGFETTACAQLWDERKQEMVDLVGHEPLLTDTLLAVFRFGPPPVRSKEFREGDSFHDGAVTFRIERIQLDPAEVAIVPISLGQTPGEGRKLFPITGPTVHHGTDLTVADRRK